MGGVEERSGAAAGRVTGVVLVEVLRKKLVVGVEEVGVEDSVAAGTAVGVDAMGTRCSAVPEVPFWPSGLAQNLTLPQLQVTTKFSKKCTSDTGSKWVLCSTRG